MAAPTLQAQGTLAVTTDGNLTVTLPAHLTNDVFVVGSGFWGPNSLSGTNPVAEPSGWTRITNLISGSPIDAEIAWFWRRATSGAETNPVFVRPTGWDSGTDTCWTGRAYVIRGAATTGNPWDEVDATALYNTANQPVDALTVSGTERLAIHFLVTLDDFVAAPTVSGWTAGTAVETTTGTDGSQSCFRKDNVSANTTADASTVAAPAAGFYAFLGISFTAVAAATKALTIRRDPVLLLR